MGKIPISEIFGPTIQGEGVSQGKRVIFIRTGFCNLKCKWCDTKYTWDWQNYDQKRELTDMSQEEIIGRIQELSPDVKSIVVSGGEPMIYQGELITLLVLLEYLKYWVEIETNGTIEPKDRLLELIDQINCSPKTSNSGEANTPALRENPDAIKKYVACNKTNFKFVVEGEGDLPEIEDFISRYKIAKDRVYLMPQAQTREEYFAIDERSGISFDTRVQILAYENGFLFTPRLQMHYWGNKRGH